MMQFCFGFVSTASGSLVVHNALRCTSWGLSTRADLVVPFGLLGRLGGHVRGVRMVFLFASSELSRSLAYAAFGRSKGFLACPVVEGSSSTARGQVLSCGGY